MKEKNQILANASFVKLYAWTETLIVQWETMMYGFVMQVLEIWGLPSVWWISCEAQQGDWWQRWSSSLEEVDPLLNQYNSPIHSCLSCYFPSWINWHYHVINWHCHVINWHCHVINWHYHVSNWHYLINNTHWKRSLITIHLWHRYIIHVLWARREVCGDDQELYLGCNLECTLWLCEWCMECTTPWPHETEQTQCS